MKTNPVGWFEIYVQDMNRAKAFYEAVFALTLSELNNGDDSMKMLAFPGDMNAYGANGALVQMPECPSGGGGTLIYFSCNDCALEASRVAANYLPTRSLPPARLSLGSSHSHATAQTARV